MILLIITRVSITFITFNDNLSDENDKVEQKMFKQMERGSH